jgi:membrane protein DedA with SNARE-associated domain
MFEALSTWLTSNIQAFGYTAVVVLMGLESANIPIPSEIVLPFAGFLVAQGKLGFHGVALAGGIGCLWGSLVSYWLGRRYGRPFLEKHGRWLFIGPRQLSQGDYLFSRFGGAVSFFSRLLPVVRTFISFVAGVWKVPVWSFSLLTFVGSWAWSYLLVYVGYKLGENWAVLRPLWHKFDAAIIIAGILGVAAYIWHHWKSTAPIPQPEQAGTDGPGETTKN